MLQYLFCAPGEVYQRNSGNNSADVRGSYQTGLCQKTIKKIYHMVQLKQKWFSFSYIPR